MTSIMKTTTAILILFYFVFNNKLAAQTDYSHQCGFNDMLDYQETLIPGFKESANTTYRGLAAKANDKNSQSSKAIYTIPVVFHVVWNSSSPQQNLDDSVLIEQIAVLNEDYSRSNLDASNTRPAFLPIVADAEIQFELACIDPNGNSTNGIVRVQTTATFGNAFLPDMASVSKIQKSTQGGSDPWNQSEYLNIWIGDINGGSSTPSLLGVATPPANLPNWPANSTPQDLLDGAIIQYNAFGRNNPNIFAPGVVINGRTVTHEVGHYLGVRHCAENTFGGLLGSICGDDDGLNDTPNCDQSQQGCDTNRNSCTDTIGGLGDLPDMVENYMDYSDQDCQNSFTQGQATIMRSVLENERVGLLTSPGIGNCNVTSIENNVYEHFMDVYPNPSTGTFIINIRNGRKTEIRIINSLGETISPTTLNTTESKIELQINVKGIYFVSVISDDNSYTKKLIIK